MYGKLRFCILIIVSSITSYGQNPAYLDPSQPMADRVHDLIGRLTLEEKVQQMMDQSPPIERLNIPGYNWWNESLHGVARSGKRDFHQKWPPCQ